MNPVLYLVTISASMDGFPIKLFENEQDAIDFIEKNPPYPWDGTHLNCAELNTACRVYGADIGGVYGYELFTLVNGQPVARRLYWWAEEGVDVTSTWKPADGWFVDGNQVHLKK